MGLKALGGAPPPLLNGAGKGGSDRLRLPGHGVKSILHLQPKALQTQQAERVRHAPLQFGTDLLVQARMQPGQIITKETQRLSPIND